MKQQSIKKYGVLVTALFLIATLLAGCAAPAASDSISSDAGSEEITAGNISTGALPDGVTAEDVDSSFDESTATKIRFDDNSTTVDGDGAAANGSTVTISKAGTYLLSGASSNAQVIVDAGDNDLVRLVLNGVSLSSATSAPVWAKNARKVIVILPDGSENTLTDAAEYVYASADVDEPDAALFSKVDLSINGSGSLIVDANFYNGIGSKDNLIIVGGNFTVDAANNAIRGRDSAILLDGIYNLTAGNDGIQSNNDTSEDQGWIRIYGGDYTIASGHDGIQAETTLDIDAGTFEITAGGGAGASVPSSTSTEESDSYKGIKATGDISVSGGALMIDSLDDAIHSNANIDVTGGDFTISTGDDGFHADSHLGVSGGSIDIQKSYEGLEGATIEVSGGRIDIVASDDGVNAAGGSSDTGQGVFGADRFSASGDYWVKISGGALNIDSQGDGLDSNGNIYMSGGEVYISGSTGNVEVAIDYDVGSFEMTGGTLIGAGMSSMAQAPSTMSTPTIMLYFSYQVAAGSTVEILDSDGNAVASYSPPKAFNNFIVNSNLISGATYSVSVNGETTVTKTLSDGLNSYDESGNAVSGNAGMGGGMQGNNPRGNGEMMPSDGGFPQQGGATPPAG